MRTQIKKIGLFRFIGASFILIALFSSLFLDYFILNNWLIFLIIFITDFLWILLSFFLKLEINFFKENLLRAIIVFSIISIILTIFSLIFSFNLSFNILIITLLSSNFSIVICWHFSISIYKKEKVIALLAGLGYGCLSIIFRVNPLTAQFGFITSLTPLFLVIIGFLIIFIIEWQMKKKNLLKYI